MFVRLFAVQMSDRGKLVVRTDQTGCRLVGLSSGSGEDPMTTAQNLCRRIGVKVPHLELLEVTGTSERGYEALFLAMAQPDVSFSDVPIDERMHGSWMGPRTLESVGAEQRFAHWKRLAMERLNDVIDCRHGALYLLPDEWTATQYRRVLEVARGVKLDPSNTRKSMERMVRAGVIEPTGKQCRTCTRPARLYRRVGPASGPLPSGSPAPPGRAESAA